MERRRVLSALGAGGAAAALSPVLAACTSGSSASTPSPSTAGPSGEASGADPRAAAAATETELLSLAAQIQARWPATASVLADVQAAHTAHVVALAGTTPSPTPAADSTGPHLPSTAAAALRVLAAAERSAASRHATQARTAPGSDARLLTSLAAYSAAQDVVLARAGTTVGVGR